MSSDTEEIAACPECDFSDIRVTGRGRNGSENGGRYYCRRCGAHFDEPVRRAPKANTDHSVGNTYGLSPAGKAISKMDPDDLVTDGGDPDDDGDGFDDDSFVEEIDADLDVDEIEADLDIEDVQDEEDPG